VAKALSPAAGAVLAQLWQSLSSLLLQILAAQALGASGLAVVSLSYGAIILATAVNSGMIGDSLTVLDRHDPEIRGSLESCALLVMGGLGALTAVGLVLAGMLTPAGGGIFLVASVAFMAEDLVRRLHMAVLGFWKLLAIDTAALAGTAMTIVVVAWRSTLSVDAFLLGVAVGQVLGAVLGWLLLPAAERTPVRPRLSRIRQVAGFGTWRGIQVGIPPAVQTASRFLISMTVGTAALGFVEAGRIFTAPATLTVQGLGSYLLSTYARHSKRPLAHSLRLARKASLLMMGGALGLGVLAVLLVPIGGGLVTGRSFSLDPVIVAGWAVYAAASASLQPFASLAVVRGRQRQVLQVRLIDSVVALASLWVMLVPLDRGVEVSPYVLAAGLVLGGLLVRRTVLRSVVKAEAAACEAMERQVGSK
jgi:O-antigen/teichoic acid export membrane protein